MNIQIETLYLMKVHLIKKQVIAEFTKKYARSSKSFAIWLWVLKNANWNKPSDIFRTFGSADLLGNASSRVIFNIGGNEFRMICKYQITKSEIRLYIKWIGTHEQYNTLCKLNQQYTIDLYKK